MIWRRLLGRFRGPSSSHELDALLDELVDDVFDLTDEELRAELREDGELLRVHPTRLSRIRRRGREEALSFRGPYSEVKGLLPDFRTAPFAAGEEMPPNPRLRAVVREANALWTRQPVGSVSNTYALVQHREAVETCFLELPGFVPANPEVELTLSQFGEWMEFGFPLGDGHTFHDASGHDLRLRFRISNSVDGSAPLLLRCDWYRPAGGSCLTVGRDMDARVLHNRQPLRLVAKQIPRLLDGVNDDIQTLRHWQEEPVSKEELGGWADGALRKKWTPSEAARVYGICLSGHDPWIRRGGRGLPSSLWKRWKAVPGERVPGFSARAETRYDAALALAWVASRNLDLVTAIRRQGQIPQLLDRIPGARVPSRPGKGTWLGTAPEARAKSAVLSAAEVRRRVDALSRADQARLALLARRYVRGTSREAGDLLWKAYRGVVWEGRGPRAYRGVVWEGREPRANRGAVWEGRGPRANVPALIVLVWAMRRLARGEEADEWPVEGQRYRVVSPRWESLEGAPLEEVFHLPDRALRARLEAAGESVESCSMEFQGALRRGRARMCGFLPEAHASPAPSLRAARAPDEFEDGYGAARRGSQRVLCYGGAVSRLTELLPRFEMAPFAADAAMSPRPGQRLVVRKGDRHWRPMAVGAVSDGYALVQHQEAVDLCLRALEQAGLDGDRLPGVLTLSALGEWMELGFVLPARYRFRDRHGYDMEFRCSISNSVDGSTALHVRFAWHRQICSNGMTVPVFGGSERSLHRRGLALDRVGARVSAGLRAVLDYRRVLMGWQERSVDEATVAAWANDLVKGKWGTHAAARVYRICMTGFDVTFQPFSGGAPSDLAQLGSKRKRVPGSPTLADNEYDVAQALSWVASRNANLEERTRRQAQIVPLLDRLSAG